MAEFGTVMGQDGLKWWIGTVEDRGTGQFSGQKDELKLGRVKVRIHGHHTENKGDLPTSDLPWCYVATPTTSASISGIGHRPSGLVEGSKVIGFFMDGDGGQYPVVFATLPHIQQKGGSGSSSPGSGTKTKTDAENPNGARDNPEKKNELTGDQAKYKGLGLEGLDAEDRRSVLNGGLTKAERAALGK